MKLLLTILYLGKLSFSGLKHIIVLGNENNKNNLNTSTCFFPCISLSQICRVCLLKY